MRRSRLPAPLLSALAVWLLVATSGWTFMVALSVYAFERSGAGGAGAVIAGRLLPAMIAAPFVGHLLDVRDRTRVLMLACLFEAACLTAAAVLISAGGALAPLVVLAALSAIAATAPRPALQALLPALARTPDELTRATGIWGVVDNGAFLLGGGIGGIAIAALGTGAVAALAAGMVALATLLIAGLPSVRATALDDEVLAESFADALAGLRAVARSSMLRVPYALFAGAVLLEGTSDVQLVALAIGKLGMGSGGPGLLYTAWGAGGMVAGAAVVGLVRRRGYGLALVGGALVLAGGLAAAGLDGVALALLAMLPAGLGYALVELAIMGLVPRLADDAVIGRVYSLSEIVYAGAAGVGALIAPLLIAALGVAGSLVAVGIAYGALTLAAWHACARIDAGQERATRIRELLRGVDFLSTLPLPRLERLVRDARAVTAPSGSEIIRIGDPGEDFFVIEHGTVEIVEFGGVHGPGYGFGEIALLRDVPRTATVRASSDVEAWAISRVAFIGAVTDHAEAGRLADALIEQQLTGSRA